MFHSHITWDANNSPTPNRMRRFKLFLWFFASGWRGVNLLCDQWVIAGHSFAHAVFAAGEGLYRSALITSAGQGGARLEPPYFVAMNPLLLLF